MNHISGFAENKTTSKGYKFHMKKVGISMILHPDLRFVFMINVVTFPQGSWDDSEIPSRQFAIWKIIPMYATDGNKI